MNLFTARLFCELAWGADALPRAVSEAVHQDDFETPGEEQEEAEEKSQEKHSCP